MDYRELNRQIRNAQVRNVYLFVNKDDFMCEKMLRLLKDSVVNAEDPSSLEVFDAGVWEMRDVVTACESMSFFQTRKLVVAHIDAFLKKPSQMQPLYAYLHSPNQMSVLVLIISDPVAKTSQLASLVLRNGSVVDFEKMNAGTLTKWITQKFTKANLKIQREAVQRIIEKSDYLNKKAKWDLGFFETEIDKLIHYKPIGDIVTLQDVEKIVATNEACDVFALCDRISEGNAPAAQKELAALLRSGAGEMRIIAMLARHFRLHAKCLILSKTITDYRTIAKEAGTYDFVVRKTLSKQNRITLACAKQALMMLESLECDIKTGKRKGALSLPCVIASLMQMEA